MNLRAQSSVDVIDLVSKHCHRVCPGPSLNVHRWGCAMATIGSRVYVVGGHDGTKGLDSVEYLDLDEKGTQGITGVTETKAYLAGLSWTLLKDLILKSPRCGHGVVQCGSYLVVAGGHGMSQTVDVLDTQSRHIWTLSPLHSGRGDCGMVVCSDGIAVFGGLSRNDWEILDWMDPQSRLFSYLLRNSPAVVAFGSTPQRSQHVKPVDGIGAPN